MSLPDISLATQQEKKRKKRKEKKEKKRKYARDTSWPHLALLNNVRAEDVYYKMKQYEQNEAANEYSSLESISSLLTKCTSLL